MHTNQCKREQTFKINDILVVLGGDNLCTHSFCEERVLVLKF